MQLAFYVIDSVFSLCNFFLHCYFTACMCICMYVYVCTGVHACAALGTCLPRSAKVRGQWYLSFSITLQLILLRKDFSLNVELTDLARPTCHEPWAPLVLPFQFGATGVCCHAQLLCRHRGSNSDLLVYIANTFLTEPLSQIKFLLCELFRSAYIETTILWKSSAMA